MTRLPAVARDALAPADQAIWDRIAVGRNVHRHVTRRIVDEDSPRIGAARGARFAVHGHPGVAPGADETLGDVARRPRGVAHQVTEMYWVSKNSINPSCAPSRPMPDCFMPPKGAAGSETSPRLSPIMPKSNFSETRMPRERSFV